MYETKNNYADFYYNFLIGEYPETEAEYIKTANIFQHLEESGINSNEIYMVAEMVKPPKSVITIDDIPDKLWENSLIERGKFYYHKELQITSPPPTWDESFDFYLEMKIRYTLDNLLDYFINRTNVREDWVNRDKEIGSIKYLLKDYKKFSFMQPVDFLLHLIDYCIAANIELNSIYDLRNKEIELANYLEVDVKNAEMQGKNKVVWR